MKRSSLPPNNIGGVAHAFHTIADSRSDSGDVPRPSDNTRTKLPQQTHPHDRALPTGQLRALGVGNAKRMPSLPEFPTVAEAGLPGYEAYAWGGMLGPAKMPVDIVQKLSREIVASINTKEVTDRMLNEGTVPTPSTPEEFTAYITSELKKWGQVINTAKIKIE